MFTNSPFSPKYGRRANIYCPVCNLRFEQEPGFYQGGLYFNYALNVALMVAAGLATYVLLDDPGANTYFGISSGLVVVMITPTSRFSKSLMVHLVGGVQFDEKYK